MGCFDCIALGSDAGITHGDVPVEVAAYVTFGDVALTCLDMDVGCLECIRVADVDCLSDCDVGFTAVDIGCADCIHIPDVNCVSEVVVAFFCLEVDIRWLVCIQVGCVVCISDVIVALLM